MLARLGLAGAQFTFAGLALAAAAGGGLAFVARRAVRRQARSPWIAVALSCAMAGTVTTAGRALGNEALRLRDLLASGDIERAGESLPALVGRDTANLDEKDAVRAAVESVAENTVDAIVAPVLFAAAFGAPGTCAYRALNTLDSMVGHRNERYSHFGWASARTDDIANWIPRG